MFYTAVYIHIYVHLLLVITKVKKKQGGLVGLVKQDDRPVSHDYAPG